MHDLRHFAPVPLSIASTRGGRKWNVDGNEDVDFLLGNGAMRLALRLARVFARKGKVLRSIWLADRQPIDPATPGRFPVLTSAAPALSAQGHSPA